MNKSSIKRLCEKAKAASRALAMLDSDKKNRALLAMSRALNKNAEYIIEENKKDIMAAGRRKLPKAFIDRLTLDKSRISSMAESLVKIAGLRDPVGETIETVKRPNGLVIKKIRVPIGLILIVYESRPNVTSDCAGLCLKSGNALILRGGSFAVNSNIAIFDILNEEAVKNRIPEDALVMITDTDRSLVNELLKQNGIIDLVMPRGGESLIREVTEKSRIPVIKHYKGVCHTFVDESANLKMAEEICYNAKVQRPGVCNAMETMLVHKNIAREFLPPMINRLKAAGVKMRGCKTTRGIVKGISAATEKDWYTEYLDLILSVRVVRDVGEAIRHIMKYGSYHSDAIVTEDEKAAARFLREVDSACVYVNASTRFTDGGEFGKGAEIGISTDKIHARGPMGVTELTSYKYEIFGSGQVRR